MTVLPRNGDGGWTRVLVTAALGIATIISTWALAAHTAKQTADKELVGRVGSLEQNDAAQAAEIGLSTRYREVHQAESARMYAELKSEVAALKQGQDDILRIVERIDRKTTRHE